MDQLRPATVHNALVRDKDNQTYSLSNPQNESLKSGERVELLGKRAKDNSGEPCRSFS